MKRRRLVQSTLGAGSLALLSRASVASGATPVKRRLITVYSRGGWDTTMIFDPKGQRSQIQTSSDGTEQQTAGLSFVASSNRPSVGQFFDRFAGQSCIVNGVSVDSISHDKCARLLFTGGRLSNMSDYASIIATESESLPLPYVILSGPRFTGKLGYNVTKVDQRFVDSLSVSSEIDFSMVESAVQESVGTSDSERINEYLRTLERRQQLRSYTNLFPTSVSVDPTSQIDLLMNLLGNDLSAVGLMQVLPPPFCQWDSHSGNDDSQNGCLEYLFEQLLYLGESLRNTLDTDGVPLIESTTVMVLSEMGRTPVYNTANGKDHWPYTSMLMFGHGIQGGRVVGATDEQLISAPIDLGTGEKTAQGSRLQVGSVLAGLLQSFDIDSNQYLDNRPFLAPFVLR